MAFHPFQSFRRHQKKLLAVLTIFVMFIFILSYGGKGGGDPIDRLMTLFGSRRNKDKTPVTKLYGSTVTMGELDDLQKQRYNANRFILGAIQTATPSTTDQAVNQEVQSLQWNLKNLRSLRFAEQELPEWRKLYATLVRDGKTEAAKYVAARMREFAVLGFQKSFGGQFEIRALGWIETHPGQLYFGGGLAGDDLLDFRIWLQQADRLNITLTDEDVRKEVNREVDGDVLTGDSTKDALKIPELLGINFARTVELKSLYAMLRDEFRARMAQQILLGGTPGARGDLTTGLAGDRVVLGGTPAQFWDFYKENFTALKVEFLKVPVTPFLAQVEEKLKNRQLTPPTDKELQELFAKYQNVEPSLDRAEPAFRIPRRVKVAWVAADPSAKYYRDLASKLFERKGDQKELTLSDDQQLTLLTAAPSAALSPCGVAGCLSPLLSTLTNAPLYLQYHTFAEKVKSGWEGTPSNPNNPNDPNKNNPYVTSVDRPETIAAFVGQVGLMGSQWATQGPWQGADVALAAVVAAQRKEMSDRHANMVLAASNPFPLAVLAQEAALVNVNVPSFDKPEVRQEMAERVRSGLAKELAQEKLDAFKKEVEARRSNPEEVEKYIEENAKPENGITSYRSMDRPMGEMEIADAPALAPLRRLYAGGAPLTPESALAFATSHFFEDRPPGSRTPISKDLYKPERFSPSGDVYYEYWLTEKTTPVTPKFKDAREKVEAAWKLEQARELARKRAEEIIEKVKKKGEETQTTTLLNDAAEQLKKDLHLPTDSSAGEKPLKTTKTITKIVDRPPDPLRNEPGRHYQPYPVTDLGIDYLPATTIEDLFKSLKNSGDATIVKDRPDRNEYVAVLVDKPSPPSEETFRKDVFAKAGALVFRDPLWEGFLREREQKYRTELMRELRKQSQAPLDDDGNFKIDPEQRHRLRNFARGGEE